MKKQTFFMVHDLARRNAIKAVENAEHGYMVQISEPTKKREQEGRNLYVFTAPTVKIDEPVKQWNAIQALTNQRRNRIMATAILNAARLRELLTYSPETGRFSRIVQASNVEAGAEFGCPAKNKYLRGRLDGSLYYSHRLAWLYMTGSWPAGDVDHKDGNRANNAWENLREATRRQNCQNVASKSAALSGVKNVYFDKASGRWQVKIMRDYKSKSYGYFRTIKEAEIAATAAKKETHEFHPEFTR